MEINKRILIVDDNLSIHDDFRKILSPMKNIEISNEYLDLEFSLFEKNEAVTSPVFLDFELDFAFQGGEAILGREILDLEGRADVSERVLFESSYQDHGAVLRIEYARQGHGAPVQLLATHHPHRGFLSLHSEHGIVERDVDPLTLARLLPM